MSRYMVCTHGDTFESSVSRNQQKANFPFNLNMKNVIYLKMSSTLPGE